MNEPKSASATTETPPGKSLLNAYIYDYLLKHDLLKSAQTFLMESECAVSSSSPSSQTSNSHQLNLPPSSKSIDNNASNSSPEFNAESGLNVTLPPNSTQKELNSSIGKDMENNLSSSSSRASDLPLSSVPIDCPKSFLYEWWNIFWDCYSAKSGRSASSAAIGYMNHAHRMRQEQQQRIVQNVAMPPTGGAPAANANGYTAQQLRYMMSNGGAVPEGDMEQFNDRRQQALQRQAIMNRGGKMQGYMVNGNGQMHPMKGQMPQGQFREGELGDMNGRPQSPSANQVASPSKRQRLSPDAAAYGAMMAGNGRFQGTMGLMAGSNPQMQQMMMNNAMNSGGVNAQMVTNQAQHNQQKQLQAYQQGLMNQQQRALMSAKQQAMPNPASPLMTKAGDGNGQAGMMGENFFPGAQGQQMRPMQGNNQGLQEYQMQLMLLEQQNKKRLMNARQEAEQQPQAMREGDMNSPAASMAADLGKRPQQKPGIMGMGDGQMHPGMPQYSHLQNDAQQQMYLNQMKMNDIAIGPNGQIISRSGMPAGTSYSAKQIQDAMNQQRSQSWNQQAARAMHQQQMPPPHLNQHNKNPQGSPIISQANQIQAGKAPARKRDTTKQQQQQEGKKKPKRNSIPVTPSGNSEPPTPTTPITPQHANSFQSNGQSSTTAKNDASNDSLTNSSMFPDFTGSEDPTLLTDFDFDSFLNTDDVNPGGFDNNSFFGNAEVETSTD